MSAACLRVPLGFVVAPLAPAILFTAYAVIIGSEGGYHIASSIRFNFMVSAFVGYPLAFFVGLPVFAIFQHARLTGFVTYALSGVVVGFVLFLLTRGMTDCQTVVPDAAGAHCVAGSPLGPALAIMGVCTLATTSFWLIVRPGRLPPC